jgi:hypothetical protein
MLVKQHAAYRYYLSVIYKRTDRRFSLSHLLGAVKREYGRMLYLRQEKGRTDKERIIYDWNAATYQTMQNLVVVSLLQAM